MARFKHYSSSLSNKNMCFKTYSECTLTNQHISWSLNWVKIESNCIKTESNRVQFKSIWSKRNRIRKLKNPIRPKKDVKSWSKKLDLQNLLRILDLEICFCLLKMDLVLKIKSWDNIFKLNKVCQLKNLRALFRNFSVWNFLHDGCLTRN